jgi:osmotically inducible protein OsmC
MKFVAPQTKLALPADTAVAAEVGIGSNDNGGFSLSVELRVTLPGIEQDAAHALIAKAHQVCPYSNATRGNIQVTVALAYIT